METKPTHAHKHITVPYIINTVVLLHVSATLVAILREVHYKGWLNRDITNVCEPMHICKILHGLKYILNIKCR